MNSGFAGLTVWPFMWGTESLKFLLRCEVGRGQVDIHDRGGVNSVNSPLRHSSLNKISFLSSL